MIDKRFMSILLLCIVLVLVGCNDEVSGIQGISIFNEDKNYVTDYIPKGKIHLSELVEDLTDKIAIITESGSVHVISSNIYVDSDKNSVFTIVDNKKIEDIKGIYMFNDFYSITDSYAYIRKHLELDKKVMFILLDGFSLRQYKFLEAKDSVAFLSKYLINEALSVNIPVTNTGFAAIITGQTPDINGVHDRSYREFKVPSIFDYALKNDIKTILLEADIKILNTEIEPELHLDMNKDGDIDDEIFETAKKLVGDDNDLMFIHFHGIDDRGHSYGPMNPITLDYIKKVDGYINELSMVWDGAMIITSDHGMHEDGDVGNHGKTIYEDMLVPFFVKEQK